MKLFYVLPLLALLSCKKEPAQTTPADKTNAKPAEKNEQKITVVSPWDFDGDGTDDDNITINVVTGHANTAEDRTFDSYTVVFNGSKLPELTVGCCEPLTIGEGDLNGDGRAELTLLQAPVNGCTYDLSIWSFQKGKWRQVFGPEMVPTACEAFTHELQDLVISENGKVYFYKADMNDEDFKKVKTEIKLQ